MTSDQYVIDLVGRPDRPRILDLFCGEGGAGWGYMLAGWDVFGVDTAVSRLARYPFECFRGDAVAFLRKHGREFDAVHASPPCPAYSIATPAAARDNHPRLIEPVREALQELGLPYVIENVVGAPLHDPVMLCGSMLGITARDKDGTALRLERHRLFETNWGLTSPGPCAHDKNVRVAGVYGGGGEDRTNRPGRGGYTPSVAVRRELMGMPWASIGGVSQAIPPAYTEYIGRLLMESLTSERAAS